MIFFFIKTLFFPQFTTFLQGKWIWIRQRVKINKQVEIAIGMLHVQLYMYSCSMCGTCSAHNF